MSFIKNFIAGAKIVFAKMKTKVFWINVLKVALPFFIVVTVISLLINSWRSIFTGDFTSVVETNFVNGQWKSFFGMKLFISVFYGLYITSTKMK